MKIIKPDICTSLNDCPFQEHCKECSHAIYKHSINVNNKTYKFEFSPQYGVTFLKKNDEPSKIYLGEKHPFWKEFEKWYVKKFK